MKTTEMTTRYKIRDLSVALKPLRDAGFISNKHHGRSSAEYTEEEAALISTVIEYHQIMDANWPESCEIAVLKTFPDEPEKYRDFLETNYSLYSAGKQLGLCETYVEKRKTKCLAKFDEYEKFLNAKKDGKIAEYITDKVCINYREIYRLMQPGVRLFCTLFLKKIDTLFYIKRADLQVSDDKSLDKYIKEAKENAMKLIAHDFAAIDEVCTGVRDYLTLLGDRERHVLGLRVGFGGKVYTLKEVGNSMKEYGWNNVVREDVRQIEARALRKVRKQLRIKGVAGIYQLVCKLRENRNLHPSVDRTIDVLLNELEPLHTIRERYLCERHQQMHDAEAYIFKINCLRKNVQRELSLKEYGLSTRTSNCLKRKGIETPMDAAVYTEGELMKISNFGQKSLEELKEKLTAFGLQLRD